MPARSTKIVFTFIAVAALAGCVSPAWYGQAMSGHMAMMHQREDIDDLLLNPDIDPELATRLQLAREARRFGIEQLSLPDTDSYTQYVPTGRSAASWNVVVAPEFSVEPRKWCFPVAGCVPYRGYFREDSADQFAARMSDRGYDTSVTPAVAYSTLGWFDDPLLESMLQRPDGDLAEVLFHELAHQALYVPGDATFNESFAGFIAEQGVRAWMTSAGRDVELGAWLERQEAGAEFVRLLADTRRSLMELYGTESDPLILAEGKADRFRHLEEQYADLVRTRWDGRDRFSGWFDPPPNNADLALVGTYTGGWCAFEALWQEADQDFLRFQDLARDRARSDAASRTRWLATPCPEKAGQAR